jgi:hypothetical protein
MPWMPLGWVGASGAVSGGATYELISTTTLGSSTPSVTFNLTAANQSAYKHLQIRMATRTDRGTFNNDPIAIRFNGDTASNYRSHYFQGDGSNATAGDVGNNTGAWIAWTTGSTAATNAFGGAVLDIIDAFSSSKNKTTRTLSGHPGAIMLNSGLWLSTASISSITLLSGTGANFISASRFSLYGVRA